MRLFSFFWMLLFVLYLPAWRAGFVSDFTGWLYDLQNSSFLDHINRTHFKVKSLYQLTQLVTWLLYQIFGINHLLWHCTHITLQAVNASLLFTIVSALFTTENKERTKPAIVAATLLFCISPTLSEVIVWEASFHYLLGFLMFLSLLRLVQLQCQNPQPKRLLAIATIYFLSTFSIELFYITPFCVAALILFYKKYSPLAKIELRKTFLYLLAPQLLFLLLHFTLVKLSFGFWLPHIGTNTVSETPSNILLSKPIKLLFHLLFFGRFYSQEFRDKVYLLCESYKIIIAFYGLIVGVLIALRLFIKVSQKEKSALGLLFFLLTMSLCLSIPLWFPQHYWVVYDRYAYFSMGFIFIACAILCQWLFQRWMNLTLWSIFALANIFATYKVNHKWRVSAQLNHELMQNLPTKSDKKVLLLNMPHFMNGLFIIPANPQNEAQLIRNLLYRPKIDYELIDVCANNILSVNDGAHVTVINDSTLHIDLNQWGTWWWYNDLGATDMEHPYFSRKMKEYGYDLILKGNPNNYLLFYQVGNRWKEVDWTKKNIDQF